MTREHYLYIAISFVILSAVSLPALGEDHQAAGHAPDNRPPCVFETIYGQPDPAYGVITDDPDPAPEGQYKELDCGFEIIIGRPDPEPSYPDSTIVPPQVREPLSNNKQENSH